MTRVHAALLCVAAWAGLAAAATGPGSSTAAARLVEEIAAERDHISAPQLADRIIAGDPALRVFDLRSAAEYGQLHIPTAQQASLETLMREPLPPDATIVLYSEGGAHAAQAWVLLRLRGYRDVFVLREGLYEWIARVIEPRLARDANPAERTAFEQAAAHSRFFGGVPQADVPRAEVAVGYWTGAQSSAAGTSRQAVAGIRRRGC
jgi:rhodanese-related sulfurtransferase